MVMGRALVVVLAVALLGSAPSRIVAAPTVFAVFLPNVVKQVNGWSTPVVIQNVGETETIVALDLFRVPDDTHVAMISGPTLRPGQSWVFDPDEQPAILPGAQLSAMVTARGAPVGALVTQGALSAWMSYGASAGGSDVVHLPAAARRFRAEGWESVVVVQNAGSEPVTASVEVRDVADGRLLGTVDRIALLPARSRNVWLHDIAGLADGARYHVVVRGPKGTRLRAIANSHAGARAVSYEGVSGGARELFLPLLLRAADGACDWTSEFVVRNFGPTDTTFSVSFYFHETGELALRMGDLSVAAGRGIAWEVLPSSLPPGAYSAVVRGAAGAELAPLVAQEHRCLGAAVAYAGIAAPQPAAFVPLLQRANGPLGWSSTLVAQNAGSVASDLRVTVLDRAGAVVAERLFPAVAPGMAVAYEPRHDGRLADGAYSAVVRANERVAVVVRDAARPVGDHVTTSAAIGGPAIALAAPPPGEATRTAGGIDFAVTRGGRAEVLADRGVTPADAAELLRVADVVASKVEAWFGRELPTPVPIYVFPSSERLLAGLKRVFGYTHDEARHAAENELSVFVPRASAIAINASIPGDDRSTLSLVLRHELGHVMTHHLARGSATLPAWLDEGLSEIQEHQAPRQEWNVASSRYFAASMAATETLFTLQELTSPALWSARSEPAFSFQHRAATQAVRLLLDDVGPEGLLELLERMGRGESFADAFRAVTGSSVDAFATAYSRRVRGLAPAYPGIATAPDMPAGTGLTVILYGFQPSSLFTLATTDPFGSTERRVGLMGEYGTRRFFLGPDFPSGTYTIRATGERDGRTITVEATATKP